MPLRCTHNIFFGVWMLCGVLFSAWRTTGDTFTSECPCNTSTVWNALKIFYDSTNGRNWNRSDHWLQPNTTVCDWYGFRNCQTPILDVPNNNLSGTLPPELSEIIDMKRVFLGNNSIGGTLPPEWGNWRSLESLRVWNNQVTGTLPESYGNWGAALHVFEVSLNRLVGTLPSEYKQWISCTNFVVASNQLSGTLPPLYGAWSKIESFNAVWNNFSGTLPPEYGNWTALMYLSLNRNSLSGAIPSHYARNLKNLAVLGLGNNFLNGTVSPGWSVSLVFELSHNPQLAGKLESLLSSCVMILSVSDTKICGQKAQLCSTLTRVVEGGVAMFPDDVVVDVQALTMEIFRLQSKLVNVLDTSCKVSKTNRTIIPDSGAVEYVRANAISGPTRTTLGIASVLGSYSGTAVSLQRLTLLSNGIDCGKRYPHEESVDFSNSPLQLSIHDGAPGSAHRGAVVGNVVCLLGLGLLSVLFCVVKDARDRKLPLRVVSLWQRAATARLPGILYLPASLLFQQTLLSSVTLLISKTPPESGVAISSGNTLCGVVGVVFCALFIVCVGVLLTVRFSADGVLCVSQRSTRRSRQQSYGRVFGLLQWWFAPTLLWRNRLRSNNFVGHFGSLFRSCSQRRYWWPLVDLLATVWTTVAVSIAHHFSGPDGDARCLAWQCIAAAGAGVLFGLTIFLRPMHRRVGNLIASLSNVAMFVSAVYTAAAPSGTDSTLVTDIVSLIVGCVCTTFSVFTFVADRYFSRIHQENMHAGTTAAQVTNMMSTSTPTILLRDGGLTTTAMLTTLGPKQITVHADCMLALRDLVEMICFFREKRMLPF